MAENVMRLSPRQRMINLMYIVLTAMLALNVSSDVLDGFVQVQSGLARTNQTYGSRNDAVYAQLELFTAQNPTKGKPWLQKADSVRNASRELYKYIDDLKVLIVKQADGPQGDINNINRRDDLESAAQVLLNPTSKRGENLRKRIDVFRDFIIPYIPEANKQKSIAASLSTKPFTRPGMAFAQPWEEAKFENQPVVAAVTLLTKLQNDIRYAEGEALQQMLVSVDAGDVRVNKLTAFVIPESRMVMRGGQYQAQIVLAAIDSTARPDVFVGGTRLGPEGIFRTTAGAVGEHSFSGFIQLGHSDGSFTKYPFSSSYTVIEPAATVSATMMNVLYAGIDNPISISVPGVPMSQVSASMTNGAFTRNGDHWVARPSTVGADAVITVTANLEGRNQTVNTTTFRVRKLPDPDAFIQYKGGRYYGGKPFGKALLVEAGGLGAAIDDGLLNIDFKVLSFETVMFDQMGNAMPEVSAGSQFSARQKEQIRRLSRGKRFFISRIRAVGPDGVTRDLSPIEVIVN